MDRGHRAVLIFLVIAGMGGVDTGELHSQAPAMTATPWVQAPPTPKPTATPSVSAMLPPAATPKTNPTTKPIASPKPLTAAPKGSTTLDETRVKMQRERELELEGAQSTELSSGDAATFNKNQQLWNKLSDEEKAFVRAQVNPRMQQETDGAYVESGLNLNDDQREVFALRYRQERRQLEREIQEKARAERGRRLPLIVDQLRKEFGRASGPNSPRPPGVGPLPPRPVVTPAPVLVPLPTAALPPGARVGMRRRLRRRNFRMGRRALAQAAYPQFVR